MDKAPNKESKNQGLVIVNTGEGKGKTTAALGVILRTYGHGMRICMIQFIKPANSNPGEVKAAKKLNIEWHQCGDGFTWQSKNMEETIALSRNAWVLAQEKISSAAYDLVVLDEFTYPLHFSWLDTGETIEWLSAYKPSPMHLIITGRYAPRQLIDYADLVTEMRLVKHPFKEGIKGQPGVEF